MALKTGYENSVSIISGNGIVNTNKACTKIDNKTYKITNFILIKQDVDVVIKIDNVTATNIDYIDYLNNIIYFTSDVASGVVTASFTSLNKTSLANVINVDCSLSNGVQEIKTIDKQHDFKEFGYYGLTDCNLTLTKYHLDKSLISFNQLGNNDNYFLEFNFGSFGIMGYFNLESLSYGSDDDIDTEELVFKLTGDSNIKQNFAIKRL